ncbi:hypothetical protein SODG_004396 [Sodalis praecaptivus]
MSESLFALPVKQTLSPSLTLRQQDELPLVVVEHPQVRAAVTLQGAHLVAWQPAGEKPVLWLSEKSAFQEGVAIRGGVPICWPWFGKVATPNHGFARILPWELSDHSEDDKQVQLTFTLRDSTLTEPFSPIRSRLRPTLPSDKRAVSNWWLRVSIRRRPRCIATSPWGPLAISTSAGSATALSIKSTAARLNSSRAM